MNKLSALGAFERKFAGDSLDGKVKQYTEKINESFQLSLSTSSLPRLPSLSSPISGRLKQQHSLLLFTNFRKEQQLSDLRSVLTSLLTVNEQANSDFEMALSARSSEIIEGEGQFERINRLKTEAAYVEMMTMKEVITTDQLVFVVKKTKEKIVFPRQTHLRQRIHQITVFSIKVLKEAPKVRTLKAESINDLTHSVYTLQKRKEEQKKLKEKHDWLLRSQKEVSKRARDENEEMVEGVARKAVVKQEMTTKARLIIQDIEDTFRQKRERQSRLEKYEETATSYYESMDRLEG